MTYIQVVKPDLTQAAKPGWCLNHVQNTYHAGWSGPTATEGWNMTKYKHPGELPPKGISAPIWFSMRGEPAGHVVVGMPDGSIYSASDSDNDPDYHPNLQHLLDFYGGRLTVRGWSEDLNGFRVVKPTGKEEEVIANENHVNALFIQFKGRNATAAEKKTWKDRTLAQFLNATADDKLNVLNLIKDKEILRAQVDDRNAKLAQLAQPKELGPGIYEVKQEM